jgi:hypothetical protein
LTELRGNIVNSLFHAVRCLRRKVTTKKLFQRVGLFALGVAAICWQTIITLPIKGTIAAGQLTITSQPLPQTDCYGNHVEFSVAVTGSVGTVYYQWQQRPPGGNFSDISGATSALLPIDNIGVNGHNVNGTEYRVLITDEFGTISSDQALLSINSITSLTPVVVNSTICNGGSITYKVFTEGNVTSNGYQWSWNNGSGWTFLSDGGAYSGTTSSQLTISNATTAQNGSYRVSVTFPTLNQPPGDPTCIETSFTRERNLVVREPLLPPVVSNASRFVMVMFLPHSWQHQLQVVRVRIIHINGKAVMMYPHGLIFQMQISFHIHLLHLLQRPITGLPLLMEGHLIAALSTVGR